MSRGTPYCEAAVSMRAARFTCGERYVASTWFCVGCVGYVGCTMQMRDSLTDLLHAAHGPLDGPPCVQAEAHAELKGGAVHLIISCMWVRKRDAQQQ
jgi:hypothetical protein